MITDYNHESIKTSIVNLQNCTWVEYFPNKSAHCNTITW